MNKRQRHALNHPLTGDTPTDLEITAADQVTDPRYQAGLIVMSTLAVDR